MLPTLDFRTSYALELAGLLPCTALLPLSPVPQTVQVILPFVYPNIHGLLAAPNLLEAGGIAMSVTKFSLSCFLMGKDRERNCTICLNAKESSEGAYMCVFWKHDEAGDFSATYKSQNWRQKGVWG